MVTDSRSDLVRGLGWVAQTIDRRVGWARLPTPIALAVLVGLRSQLRALNLFDTDPQPEPPADPSLSSADHPFRTIDGRYNNLERPDMGAAGARFGRNVPLADTEPETGQRFTEPNPRRVSRNLLTRNQFEPATTLNLLAAAWIQFQVHDWVSHLTPAETDPVTDTWPIALDPDDPWPNGNPMRVRRTPQLPGAPGQPPTYANRDTHWWDGSQIYGDDPVYAAAIRDVADDGTPLATISLDDATGLPPAGTDDLLDPNGPVANFWVGLGLMHSLFLREHNMICRRLASAYPELIADQDRLYNTARLVNTALMAKIHTVDWTTAIIAHPTTVTGMRGNWFGLLGENFNARFGRVIDNEVLCGIPGGHTELDGVPFALTEEFVSVYRMHPLLPDDLKVCDHQSRRAIGRYDLTGMLADQTRAVLADRDMADLLYSFGIANPGALTLHNFPTALQNLARPDGMPVDLATIDVLRGRERGVPRYNEFRRRFRLPAAKSFLDLTRDPKTAAELAAIYRDVDDVDILVGLYAEPKPPGFGFSETAFRVFILMASRRIAADRFLTTDFGPQFYTEVGMAWIRDNTMRSVLLRHHPTLAPALADVKNPFAPWPAP